MNDIERIKRALRGGSTVGEATWVALARVEEELRQSAYYRECRDKWRDQAQGLLNRLETAHCGGCQCDPEGVQ